MARVYVSLGSNIRPAEHMRKGVSALRARFGALSLSSVYDSAAVGFSGDNFYNMVAGFDADAPVRAVAQLLHDIEEAHGRVRSGPRFSSRTLDIDLLLYDTLIAHASGLDVPRAEITRHAFVLQPLAEIAPDYIHPEQGRSLARLWAELGEGFRQEGQLLRRIPFDWGDEPADDRAGSTA